LSAVAEQLYISASSAGLGREDDAGIVRTYLPANSPSLVKDLIGVEQPENADTKTATVIALLEGIHLVATAEAIALAARCGTDTKSAYNIISNAAGTSRIFESRGTEMVERKFNSSKTLEEATKTLVGSTSPLRLFRPS
jgi:3-hydroxyisobutyrate dehydrogenase